MRSGIRLAALGAAAMMFTAGSAAAESRSYAVYWFAQASYSQDGDCEGGLNPKIAEQYAKNLGDLGIKGPEAEKLLKEYADGGEGGAGWSEKSVRGLMNSRARVGGEPANAYMHPAAVVDPHLKYVTGKYAYGFNLDGKGADEKTAFEDPDTHEKGVDNQLFRALGCMDSYRGTLEHDNGFWSFMWMAEKDSSPAWLITLTGEDLSKDGPITVTFGRAMETAKFNAGGDARQDMTFRADPDPRLANNVFKGEIKNGEVTITEPAGKLFMTQDQLTYPIFNLHHFRVRFTFDANGEMKGLLGGYQPIEEVYFCLAEGGQAHEVNEAPELPGTYWLLRKLADADPDKNGQNWSISATYHIRAVPAFAVPAVRESRPAPVSAGGAR